MAFTLLHQAARLSAEGYSPTEVAARLQMSEAWTRMLMGTDGFALLREKYRAEQNTEAEAGDPQVG